MDTQTLTQTVTITVANTSAASGGGTAGVPNTGLASAGTYIGVGIVALVLVVVAALLVWRISRGKRSQQSKLLGSSRANNARRSAARSLSALLFLSLGAASLAIIAPLASAAPSLTLGADQQNLAITIPQGGGTASSTTTITTGTANVTGYALTAELAEAEPGISIALKGGIVGTSTPLTANATPLTLKTTSAATAGDITNVTLDFTIDGTVTAGTKALKLTYKAVDNAPAPIPAPTTMQSLTKSYCTNTMTIYDGTNESAILTLADTRGGTTRTYRVAKLADGNCWMLDNLKLGSTTAATTLTPTDTNIASNFTLPQLNDGSRVIDVSANPGNDIDTPYTYGPVPGDTGTGATNYGYFYNWSAATAGETRTSMPGDGTNGNIAPHDICAANWRLPTGGAWDSGLGEFAALDRAFGGNGMDVWSGEPNIAKWQPNGPFKGTFAGHWWYGGFSDQGSYGVLWSGSANPGNATSAPNAFFYPDEVSPGNTNGRYRGVAVRCLLN